MVLRISVSTPSVATLVVVALLLGAGPVSGQGRSDSSTGPVGTVLDPDHWAVAAARRLDAVGVIDGYLPAQRAVPLEVLERALADAAFLADGATTLSPIAQHLAAAAVGWHRLLLEEYPALGRNAGGGRVLGQRAGIGGLGRRGATAPGLGEGEPDRTGALPLPDETHGIAVYDGSFGFGRHFAARSALHLDLDGVHVGGLQLVGGVGPINGLVGRSPVGYGPGFGGSVALSGSVPLDAVQLGTRTPLRLPGFLNVVGPLSFHSFFGRMNEARHPGDPFIWGASGYIRPLRRVTLGVHRAALFGGDPANHPVTLRNVFQMMIGRVVGIGFEDQIVSASGTVRLPTEYWLPLTAYVEWGAEDATGAWWDVPGRVIGLWSPALPFAPAVDLGVEFSHFGTSCCLNPPWYRHWSFVGSWASRDRALGHPLGGDGRELLLHAGADIANPRIRLDARAFGRTRREENLYSPERAGRSRGASAGLELRQWRHMRIRLEAARETGSGWAESSARIQGEYIY